ncbi:Regulatory-associated protein of TOR1 RAPTOR1 [Carpediemonas membranifera]|uniref:Regulatory-associated protein of TOR1 RAPTOR1 n=1 Tax=Carpediemonas membranifera TaxID=201153 RepID=A0A8J6E4R3_9EUKA|nr:Regulatory-associated protein of TOR1 RAPTOR1 [Carpediemonas membranifera]|eukprot:KAG9394837.1 Regulatory-associated protein of TOR1 RAPTOR1 [Carpediemonas membranifera]
MLDDSRLFFSCHRHENFGFTAPQKQQEVEKHEKYSVRTKSTIVAMNINLGTDPPGICRDSNHAHEECFQETIGAEAGRKETVDLISKTLQRQYAAVATAQSNTVTKPQILTDTSPDKLKSVLSSCRTSTSTRLKAATHRSKTFIQALPKQKSSRSEQSRILFHYIGHGMPSPNVNGELWLLDGSGKRYLPCHVSDIYTCMEGGPTAFLFDCNNAGRLKPALDSIVTRLTVSQDRSPGDKSPVLYPIAYFACGPDERLPVTSGVPADLFTSCLTAPIRTAMRMRHLENRTNPLTGDTRDVVTNADIDAFPGNTRDRKTPLGELHWILIAILDAICSDTFGAPLFRLLCRTDTMIATLTRNFQLARFIMRRFRANPISLPVLPDSFAHPLWGTWLDTLDHALSMIPALQAETRRLQKAGRDPNAAVSLLPSCIPGNHPGRALRPPGVLSAVTLDSGVTRAVGQLVQAKPKLFFSFFTDQLTAFEVYLDHAHSGRTPPIQLPVLLQSILSQVHRIKTLELFCRFLDLGPWAIQVAVNADTVSFMLALLFVDAEVENRHLLSFIWAKLLQGDSTAHHRLVADRKYQFFIDTLRQPRIPADRRYLILFIFTTIMRRSSATQDTLLHQNLLGTLVPLFRSGYPAVRTMAVICAATLCNSNSGLTETARHNIFETTAVLATDKTPEVRAAAMYMLAVLAPTVALGDAKPVQEEANTIPLAGRRVWTPEPVNTARAHVSLFEYVTVVQGATNDPAPIVRTEAMRALAVLISKKTENAVNGAEVDLASTLHLSVTHSGLTHLSGMASPGTATPSVDGRSWIDVPATPSCVSEDLTTEGDVDAAFAQVHSALYHLAHDGVDAIATVGRAITQPLEAVALTDIIAASPAQFQRTHVPDHEAGRRRHRLLGELSEKELEGFLKEGRAAHLAALKKAVDDAPSVIVELVSSPISTPLLLTTNLHAASIAAFNAHSEVRECPVHGSGATPSTLRLFKSVHAEQCPACRFGGASATLLSRSANCASGFAFGTSSTKPYVLDDPDQPQSRTEDTVVSLSKQLHDAHDEDRPKDARRIEKQLKARTHHFSRTLERNWVMSNTLKDQQIHTSAKSQFPAMMPHMAAMAPRGTDPVTAGPKPLTRDLRATEYWTRDKESLSRPVKTMRPFSEEVQARALYHFCYQLNDSSSMPYSLPGDENWAIYHDEIDRENAYLDGTSRPGDIDTGVQLCSGPDADVMANLPEQSEFTRAYVRAMHAHNAARSLAPSVVQSRAPSPTALRPSQGPSLASSVTRLGPGRPMPPAPKITWPTEASVSLGIPELAQCPAKAIDLHSMLPEAVVATRGTVYAWDSVSNTMLNSFTVCRSKRHSIVGTHILNTNCTHSMLLTLSTDDNIRVFSEYDRKGAQAVVTSFRVAPKEREQPFPQSGWLKSVTSTLQASEHATLANRPSFHTIQGVATRFKSFLGVGALTRARNAGPNASPPPRMQSTMFGSTASDLVDLDEVSSFEDTVMPRSPSARPAISPYNLCSCYHGGKLYVSRGRDVTIYDLSAERATLWQDVTVRIITNITVFNHMVGVTDAGGQTLFFDERAAPVPYSDPKASAVFSIHNHLMTNNPITPVVTQLSGQDDYTLINGISDGTIEFTDIRKLGSGPSPDYTRGTRPSTVCPVTIKDSPGMTALAVHRGLGLIATGNKNQLVKIYDFSGNHLDTIKPLAVTTFIEENVASPVGRMKWHPINAGLCFETRGRCVSFYDPK